MSDRIELDAAQVEALAKSCLNSTKIGRAGGKPSP
jgi:hypothetical protein